MKVLITGASGQLGRELVRRAPAQAEVVAFNHRDCDIGDATAVTAVVSAHRPDVILNAAAYTAVDKAEGEPDAAHRVNALGPRHLAAAAGDTCRVIHVSTDYVFGGDAPRPYRPRDATSPQGVYGQTKLDGERGLLEMLGARGAVLRTAWVYAASGANFLLTMLRLMREKGTVRVVADQIGAPTAVRSLSEALWAMAADARLQGIHHWSDSGVASWYDFAVAIAEEAAKRGLVPQDVVVSPISTEEYPTRATRPRFSLLDSRDTSRALNLQPLHWRVRLREVLDEVAHV